MTGTITLEAVGSWRDNQLGLLTAVGMRLRSEFTVLLTGAAESYGFHDEGVQNVRIKEAGRIEEKLNRPPAAECLDDILHFPSAVPDLVGARVLMRTIDDVDAVCEAIERNAVGDVDPVKEIKETGTGYRAVHFDGAMTMNTYPGDVTVPFEVQVQTIAQHAFDRHTHDSAYVRRALNSDERFEIVRGMHRTLAQHLHVADLLMCEIDHLMEQVLTEIEVHPVGDEVSFETVFSVVRGTFSEQKIGPGAAQRLAEDAQIRGVTTLDQLRALVKDAEEHQVELADRLRVRLGREPGPEHLISEVMRDHARQDATAETE